MGEKSWNWGVIGPGRFASEFVDELKEVDEATLWAVASRTEERSAEFAARYGFERWYGDYESLVTDTEVDIVYIAIPHSHHRAVAEWAINAGKAVLCEKPLTPSLVDTKELIGLAKQRGVFLMEAMKTGFLPAIREARKWIEVGKIGEVVLAKADFCFPGSTDPEDRLMNPELAGGAVLDVGIYPIYLVESLVGEITSLDATGTITETGVEDTVAMVARHEGGAMSSMTCSFRTQLALDASIMGTKGEIRIPLFHAAKSAECWKDGVLTEEFNSPDDGGMVKPEIEAVHAALSDGLLECPGHSHEQSIVLAQRMEDVRRQLGVIPQKP